jgi:hypothetical protein
MNCPGPRLRSLCPLPYNCMAISMFPAVRADIVVQNVVAAKARRAAAERVVGKCLSKWAHTRVAARGEQLMNRVRRKMAVFKIEKMVKLVTERKRRPYQYQLLVRRPFVCMCCPHR